MEVPSHVAIKVTISDLLEGTFVAASEISTAHILTTLQQRLERVNIIAILLRKEQQGAFWSFLLDDGTGVITLHSFEGADPIRTCAVGDVVLVVGRPRRYNQALYIAPEITKKVAPRWLQVRSGEIQYNIKYSKKRSLEKKDTNYDAHPIKTLPQEKIIKTIASLDQGNGVLIEEVIEKTAIEGISKTIEMMLEQGILFCISPGRVRLL